MHGRAFRGERTVLELVRYACLVRIFEGKISCDFSGDHEPTVGHHHPQ